MKARTKVISKRSLNVNASSVIEEAEEHEPSKPLSQTLTDLQLEDVDRENMSENGNHVYSN